jgi:hypothetical protein
VDTAKVELSVNVYSGDVSFLEETYRHIAKQLDYPFARRRIVVDKSTATGRFVNSAADDARLDEILSSLRTDGLVDAIDEIDWSDDERRRVLSKWLGDADSSARGTDGSAVYQYLWALDTAQSAYILHLDADVLFHVEDGCAWINEGIRTMRENPAVAVITPEGGPPSAEGVRGWRLGPRSTQPQDSDWHVSASVSTRKFLMDLEKVDQSLPLRAQQTSHSLEQMFTDSFATSGLQRWSRNDDHTYSIHPRRHNRNHSQNLRGLIDLVERGDVPFRRTGYRWDIRTEGRHFAPWWIQLQRRRLGAGIAGLRSRLSWPITLRR